MNSRDDLTPGDVPDAAAPLHETPAPRRLESRVIPPSGPVSPDGKRPWPQHSLKTRLLVWGGLGVMTAAATAATVLTVRHLAQAVTGDPPEKTARSSRAPRFADLTEEQRDEMRARVRSQARQDSAATARMRARAARRRNPPRRNAAVDMTRQATELTKSLVGLVGTLGTAMAAFRVVAEQADTIRREFSDVADTLSQGRDPVRSAPSKDNSRPDA